MEESEEIKPPEILVPDFRPYEPKVWMVLLTQTGLFIVGAGVGGLVFIGLCLLMGWNPYLSLTADAPAAARWQVRIQLGLGHLFAFLGSGVLNGGGFRTRR